MKNYTDVLFEEYAKDIKEATKESFKLDETLTNPRTYDELDAARAAIQAKQAKLNIELAKLDAECAARMSQEAEERVGSAQPEATDKASEVAASTVDAAVEASAADDTTADTPLEATAPAEDKDTPAVDPAIPVEAPVDGTVAVVADPIEEPKEEGEEDKPVEESLDTSKVKTEAYDPAGDSDCIYVDGISCDSTTCFDCPTYLEWKASKGTK